VCCVWQNIYWGTRRFLPCPGVADGGICSPDTVTCPEKMPPGGSSATSSLLQHCWTYYNLTFLTGLVGSDTTAFLIIFQSYWVYFLTQRPLTKGLVWFLTFKLNRLLKVLATSRTGEMAKSLWKGWLNT